MTSQAEASRTPAPGAHYRLAVSRDDTMVVAVTPGGEIVRGPGFVSAQDAALLVCEYAEKHSDARPRLNVDAERMRARLRWYRTFSYCLAALTLLLALAACACQDWHYCPPTLAPKAE